MSTSVTRGWMSSRSRTWWWPLVALTAAILTPVGAATATDFYSEVRLVPSDGADDDWFGDSVAFAGGTIVAGAPYDDNSHGTDAGAVYVFTPDGSGGYTQTKLMSPDGADGGQFGHSVAADGDTIVVAASRGDGDDDGSADVAAAYVFTADGAGGYATTTLFASDGGGPGGSVAVDGGTIVVGDPFDHDKGPSAGAVYVFTPDGSGGYTETKLVASDGAAESSFGKSVALDDDTVVVGAPNDDNGDGTNAGAVYMFTADGSGGYTEDKLLATDGDDHHYLGETVAVDGGTVVAGAPDANNENGGGAGSVYAFTDDGSGGYTQVRLIASDGETGDFFGTSVAIGGRTIVVGAAGDDNRNGRSAGSVYAYTPDGSGGYTESTRLATDGDADDMLGWSVAVDGGTVVAGAPHMDTGGGPGGVHVFTDGDAPDGWVRNPERLAGATRYATAVAIALHQFPLGADTVYLARADNVVDAVAGGVLTNGPILLVDPCGPLPDVVVEALNTLAPDQVTALGGTTAICNATLADAGVHAGASVDRVAGSTRYATAAEIALHQFPEGADTVYLARADNVVDAVAGGVLTNGPILLVDPCGPLPDVVVEALNTLAPDQVTALGGTTAICNDTLNDAKQLQ